MIRSCIDNNALAENKDHSDIKVALNVRVSTWYPIPVMYYILHEITWFLDFHEDYLRDFFRVLISCYPDIIHYFYCMSIMEIMPLLMPLNKTKWVKHKNIWTVSYIMWVKYPHLVFIFVPNSAYSNKVVASSRNLKSSNPYRSIAL